MDVSLGTQGRHLLSLNNRFLHFDFDAIVSEVLIAGQTI
jgi:hypothetical protein